MSAAREPQHRATVALDDGLRVDADRDREWPELAVARQRHPFVDVHGPGLHELGAVVSGVDRQRAGPRANMIAALAGHRAVTHGARAILLAVENPVAPRLERGRNVDGLSDDGGDAKERGDGH